MADATVLRLLTFRTGSAGPVLDVALRDDVLPYLESRRGLVDVYVGRHGTARTDERVVVTTWQSRSAMVAALADGSEAAEAARGEAVADDAGQGDVARLLPSHAADIEDERVAVFELAFAFRIERERPPRVLRVVRGEVRDGLVDAFVDAVHAAALRAAQTVDGTVAFELGISPTTSFAVVSVWPDWSAIEQGTGASVRDTSAILAPDHVLSSQAVHFEILDSERASDPTAEGAAGSSVGSLDRPV